MRILLLSAYDTDSHQSWCKGLMTHIPTANWTYLTLPGRFFSWRIRGNPLSWAYGEQQAILHEHYDLIIATSMVDLATLRGLIPSLGRTPCIMYFHENQFAYPKSSQQHTSIEPQMVNLYSALSAETVLFNSQYNLDSFTQHAADLLKKLPDHAPARAIEAIRHKSSILPVPVNTTLKPQKIKPERFDESRPLNVIWNHRWEYDKGPDLLHLIIQQVEEKKRPIRFTIAGLSFRNIPTSLQTIMARQYPCVAHIGTLKNKQDYVKNLTENDVVLSTAFHEFQGLAMLEAAAHGCIPLAPNRLAYPEWIPQACLYPSHDNLEQEAIAAFNALDTWLIDGLPKGINVDSYSWGKLAPIYLKVIEQTIGIAT